MYTIPTLRGDGLFLVLSSLGLAILLAMTTGTLPVATLSVGIALGVASGVAHVLAISQLPRQLTNASADLPARRRAFLASRAGQLHVGIDTLVGLLLLIGIFWSPLHQPLPAFVIYWVARFAISFASLLPPAMRRQQQ